MDTFKTNNRNEWREWLNNNFETKNEIWFVFPTKAANEESISYNDAVEEALCFGWIDGRAGKLDEFHSVRRFTKRKPNSGYSRINIERLIWLEDQQLIHPSIRDIILPIINEPFIYPQDIMDEIKKDQIVFNNFNHFSLSYQRIRISYIDEARDDSLEFQKRLNNFILKTKENKLITGFGGIDKYYK